MRHGKPAEAAMAANSLLDRGWGKPTQQISGEFNVNREAREMSTSELVTFLAQHGVVAGDEPLN
jgi:hypothetical protein